MPKILIIEDEATLSEALSAKISKAGMEVSLAKDGQEGLEKALASHPDLILLDIIMPRMDGITMLKKLRSDEWGQNAKVILLTNLRSSEKADVAFEENVPDYLVKVDWKLDDVIGKINEKLKQ